jgi:hypothetical protein
MLGILKSKTPKTELPQKLPPKRQVFVILELIRLEEMFPQLETQRDGD